MIYFFPGGLPIKCLKCKKDVNDRFFVGGNGIFVGATSLLLLLLRKEFCTGPKVLKRSV